LAGKTQIPWPDDRSFLSQVDQVGPTKVAAKFGVSRSAVQHHARKVRSRAGLPEPERDAPDDPQGLTEHANGSKSGVVHPDAPWSAEQVIRFFGDDPDECQILSKRGTFWGDPAEPNHHLRVNWISKKDMIQPADPSSWTPPAKPKRTRKTGPEKVVVVSDHHAPFEDRDLHACFLQYLEDEKPERGIINGDLLDFHTISRHRNRDGFDAPVNECLQAAFNILRDYRHASPDTQWILKKGNHCQRLEDGIVDNVKGLHRVTIPGDDVPALSLRRLLRLDELGIEFIAEDWDMAKVRLSKKLSVRHGPVTSKAAGQRLLDKFSVSVIQGHTHRLSLTFRTEHTDEDDVPTTTRMGAEGGCMCQIHEGLGYADSPDWNQGFLTAHVYPDGDFHVLPGIYVPSRLLAPNGQRYEP
jgi:metallophosphoesterase superfamily enzyme